MEKRVLFIVNQLFQLMVVTQIRQTLFKDSEADLLLIDSSSGIRDVYENIQEADCFNHIYITKRGICKSELERVKMILTQIVDRKWRFFEHFDFVPSYQYDVIFLNEFSLLSCLIALYLSEKNDVSIYRHEEGFGSYLSEFGTESKRFLYTLRAWSTALKLLERPSIFSRMKGHYYFYPELIQYKPVFETYTIPPINIVNEQFKSFVLTAYPKVPDDEFDKKYIFFEENITDSNIDDFSLIMKIAEKVGKENLMIKLHPRRPVDRFTEHGIKVSRTTGIPWEAILLQHDFSNKVLMTISSSVAFSSRLYLNSNIETYMLFKLFDKMNPAIPNQEKFLCYVDGFRRVYDDKLFSVPDNTESFLKMLTR